MRDEKDLESQGTEVRSGSAESEPREDRGVDFTRRGLMRAGWVAPLILIATPEDALAQALASPGAHVDAIVHDDLVEPHIDGG